MKDRIQLPNPLKIPTVQQRIEWIINPTGFMEKAVQQYPDLFSTSTRVSVIHPQGIQKILTNDHKIFVAPSKTNTTLQPLLGDYSVIMVEGSRHKQQRQLLMPPFHKERMPAYSQLICNLTEKVFSQLPQNQPFQARNVLQEISLQVILEVVFGLCEGERYKKLKRLLTLITDLFKSLLSSSILLLPFLQHDLGSWSPWGKFVRQRQQIDKLLYAEIAERRQQYDPDRIDILSLLMAAKDEQGEPMSDRELRDELMTMLFAGHETTASAMAWGLYWIHYVPQVREKLLQELDFLGESPNPMTIARLPYLTAVCNETLRIYPAAMLTFPRVAQERVELLGHQLEPGTVVVGCTYLLHHREDLYPESKQFKPERFLERQFSPYEFIPFGGGVRRCVGEALAQLEIKLVLATILSRYQLALFDNRPEKPCRRGLTIAPAYGVKMVMTGQRLCH